MIEEWQDLELSDVKPLVTWGITRIWTDTSTQLSWSAGWDPVSAESA